jgi:hypothetical protein
LASSDGSDVPATLADLRKAEEALWEMLARGVLQLLPLGLADVPRIRELMSKYPDRPMDLADAALVRVADGGLSPLAPTNPKKFTIRAKLQGAGRLRSNLGELPFPGKT